MGDIPQASAELIQSVQSQWQFFALVVVIVGAIVIFWINRTERESKKLLETRDKLNQEEVRKRELERSGQLSEMKLAIQAEINALSKSVDKSFVISEGVGKSLDRHIENHKKEDGRTQDTLSSMNQRLKVLEDNVIDKTKFEQLSDTVSKQQGVLIEIKTILSERLPSKT